MLHAMLEAVASGTIITHLGFASYMLVFTLVLIEGPATTLAAAALAGAGRLDLWGVFFAASAGNLTADGLWYLIGYAGRLDAVRKRLPGFTRFDARIRALEKRLQKDGVKLLVISKLSFGIAAIPVLIAAGLAKVSWRRILAAAGSCQVLLGGALVAAGYFMGKSAVRHRLGLEAALFFGGLLLLTLAMVVHRYVAVPGGNCNLKEQAGKS